MTKVNLHKDLQKLAIDAYNNEKISNIGNWRYLYSYSEKNGLQAKIYKNNNKIVIAYRGTEINNSDIYNDIKNDLEMLLGQIPEQYQSANEIFNKIKRYFNKNYEIILTGHSLGGSLAQLVAATNNSKGVTFNAYGTGDILYNIGIIKQNTFDIINYGNINDSIFNIKYDKHPGKTLISVEENNNNNNNSSIYLKKIYNFKIPDIKYHYIDFLDLDKCVKIEKLEKESNNKLLLKGYINYEYLNNNKFCSFSPEQIGKMSIEEYMNNEEEILSQYEKGLIKNKDEEKDYSGYINPISGKNRVFTREDIDKMTTEEFIKHQEEILIQTEAIGVPYKDNLSKNTITYAKDKNYYSPKNGKWVTIDGNHVFIENE